MEITREQLIDQLEDEIAKVTDPAVSNDVRALLIEPTLVRCAWGYGAPGETYPCWKMAQDNVRGVGIVYCAQGFGPKSPWGLVWLREPIPEMGQDCGWFSTFREAVADLLDLPAVSLII